ncbi:MAG: hypothetical protein DHS20C21_21420 [Gemmatimonadota bacterium]|nr:MAG: hypothetical protein DHS20C21_21420 [Gemmatimonadota bacterium]
MTSPTHALLVALVAAIAIPGSFPSNAGAIAEVTIVLPQGSLTNDAVTVGPDGLVYATYCFFGQPTRHILRSTPDGVSEVFTSFPTASCTLGMTFDDQGTLYVANLTKDKIQKVFADGSKELYYGDPTLDGPADLEFHPSGNGDLYVVNNGAESISVIHPDQTMEFFYQGPGLTGAHAGTFDDAGNYYVANTDGTVVKFLPDGTLVPFANFNAAYVHCTGTRLFASNLAANQIWELSLADGSATWIAGSGVQGFVAGPADVAQLHSPNGIASDPSGTVLYVSSGFGNGLFRIVLDEAVAAPVQQGAVSGGSARLLGGGPNPFTTSTRLSYELPTASAVQLTVYDVRGRRVRELVAARRAPGIHTVEWDGRDSTGSAVGSGIYWVRLRAGDATDAGRLTRRP